MPAYQLLARLKLLSLCGQNEDGELEWIGTSWEWNNVIYLEDDILSAWEVKNAF